MTERIRALEAIARTLEGAQMGVHQLAFAHLPVGAALRVAAAGGDVALPAPIAGLTSPLLGLTARSRDPGPAPAAVAVPGVEVAAAAAVARAEPPAPGRPVDPGAAALEAGALAPSAPAAQPELDDDAGEEETRVTGPVLVFAPLPEPGVAGSPEGSTEADAESPGDGMDDLPTLHDAPAPPRVPGPTGSVVGGPDPDAFDEPTFLGLTPASAFGPGDGGDLDAGPEEDGPPAPDEDADEEATLADTGSAFEDEGPFGPAAEPARDPAAAFADRLDAEPPPADSPGGDPADVWGDAGGAAPDPWGASGRGGGSSAGAGVQLRFIRPEAEREDDDPFAEADGWNGASSSPADDGSALFEDDDEEEATRVGTAAVSLRAAVDAALRSEPADADFDGDQLEFESSAPAPAPARPAPAAAPDRPAAAPAPALSAPRLGAPRVVEPEPDRPEGASGAAIQILGFGKARTLTPTLALEGAPEEIDGDADGEGGFSVAFEEPDEESTGPRIPMLTEGAPVPERPAVGLSAAGAFVPSAEPALAPQTAAGFLARARAAEQAGNLRDAVECYGDLLSFDPYSLDAHLGRGRCLVDLGDYGAAMSDFTRAEDLAPDSPEPVVEMGNLYFARKEYKKAIAYYDHAIEQSPNHAMALCRRGICYYHRKRMSEAHADLKRAEALGAQVPGLQRYIQMTARGPAKR